MNFLALVVTQLVQWILTKLGTLLVATWQKFQRKQEIEHKAEESVVPLKNAQTAEEIDKASQSAVDGI